MMPKTKTTPNQHLRQLDSALDTMFFKALAEPARIELIRLLVAMPSSDVGTLAQNMSQDRSVISRHLKVMLEADLVSCVKEGKHSYYQLNGSVFVEKLEDVLETVKSVTGEGCC